VCDGVVNGLRRGLEQVGEPDVQTAFPQADGGVEGSEVAEADVEVRDGRAWSQLAVFELEDVDEMVGGGKLWGTGSLWLRQCLGLFWNLYGKDCFGRRCGVRCEELQEQAQG